MTPPQAHITLKQQENLEMMDLPKEMLLQVMSYLNWKDVLNCRLVCKRLKELSLHPTVWKHRSFEVERSNEDGETDWMCPVLRLAPCVSNLTFRNLSRGCSLRYSTRCAARRLHVYVQPGEAFQAALIIRNQDALGRLAEVDLLLLCGNDVDGLSVLFETLATLPRLEKLVVSDATVAPLPRNKHHTIGGPVAPLKHFEWHVSPLSNMDQCDAILARHAATLETVRIENSYRDNEVFSASPRTAGLLASMPNLSSLHCPPLPGLAAVAACPSLRTFALAICAQTQPDYASAAEFLRRAIQLRDVRLLYFTRPGAGAPSATGRRRGRRPPGPDPVLTLIPALASSGQSQVEDLSVSAAFDEGFPQAPVLVGALPKLPHLRHLRINKLSDELFMGITPNTAPALETIRLAVYSRDPKYCTHNLTHQYSARRMMAANPSLLILRHFGPSYCFVEDKFCPACKLGCHPRLLLDNFNFEKHQIYKDPDGGRSWVIVDREEFSS